jgi:hypothetical protein
MYACFGIVGLNLAQFMLFATWMTLAKWLTFLYLTFLTCKMGIITLAQMSDFYKEFRIVFDIEKATVIVVINYVFV